MSSVTHKQPGTDQGHPAQNAKEHLSIVFIGHVDAGKSTIGGHLMVLTGMVDKRTLERYEKEAKEKNRESWYLAWALDTDEDERDKGKTRDVGRAHFETKNKHFTILDAPGHKSFVPKMVGGATQADVAVLVISARKGEFETGFERGQTKEHSMLVKTAGVRRLIVVVNKMDDPTVEWDEARFNSIKNRLTPYLRKCGFNPNTDIYYIPVSGLTGINLKETNTEMCPWYDGPSLIDYLDSMPAISRAINGPVRLPVESVAKDMGTFALGKLESGSIQKGQVLTLMPNRSPVEVLTIWSDEEEKDKVFSGENVKLKIKHAEEDITHGFVLCSPDNLCQVAKVFEAQIVLLECKSIVCAGFQAELHLHNFSGNVEFTDNILLVDKNTNKRSAVIFLRQGQNAVVRLSVGSAICIETFNDFPQMGRFVLRKETQTIAMGKVLRVIE